MFRLCACHSMYIIAVIEQLIRAICTVPKDGYGTKSVRERRGHSRDRRKKVLLIICRRGCHQLTGLPITPSTLALSTTTTTTTTNNEIEYSHIGTKLVAQPRFNNLGLDPALARGSLFNGRLPVISILHRIYTSYTEPVAWGTQLSRYDTIIQYNSPVLHVTCPRG